MATEIYLYSSIYSEIAQLICQQLEELMDEPVVMRLNSPGGSVFAGWSIASKIQQHGNVEIIIDGACMSMATALLPYAKKVTALDVAQFMIHRADMWVSTEEEKTLLANMNADMLKRYKKQLDSAKFKEVTGVSLDTLFTAEDRKNIFLTAKQAAEIGMIDKIQKLSASEAKAFNDKMFQIAALAENPPAPKPQPQQENKNSNKMDLSKLQAEHPEVYAKAIALGVAQEKDRVKSWLAFHEIDAKASIEGIEKDETVTASTIATFQATAIKSLNIKAIEAGSPKTIETTSTELTAEQKKAADFEKEIDAKLGLKEKN